MSTYDQPILRHSRLSRAEALAREVEEEISAGVVKTGDRLGTKDDLRRRFGVAVATVNEAVKLLETRGLVGARPGSRRRRFRRQPRGTAAQRALDHGF
jgi:DNA-binding FadR family transcriptional regulator